MTTVDVLQEDIDDGLRGVCGKCPIHLAMRRLVHPNVRFSVGCSGVTFYPLTADHYSIGLPLSAQGFVYRFDELGNNSVLPFSFDLDIPAKYLRGTQ